MSQTYESPQEVMERVDGQTRRAMETMERARTFAGEVDRLRGRSTWRGVTAEVDAHGLLVRIDFLDAARTLGPGPLAQATMVAHRAALRHVTEQVAHRARETWGDDPIGQQIVDEMAGRFGIGAP